MLAHFFLDLRFCILSHLIASACWIVLPVAVSTSRPTVLCRLPRSTCNWLLFYNVFFQIAFCGRLMGEHLHEGIPINRLRSVSFGKGQFSLLSFAHVEFVLGFSWSAVVASAGSVWYLVDVESCSS